MKSREITTEMKKTPVLYENTQAGCQLAVKYSHSLSDTVNAKKTGIQKIKTVFAAF